MILGDMNIENKEELQNCTPHGYLSLNDEFRKTNTAKTKKAYDHVMYNTEHTSRDIDTRFDLVVIDLIDVSRATWTSNEPYPGNPYDHNVFRQYYSDHHPVVFKMVVKNSDDD